ncbi:AGE family epimerase/isomerase [Tuwongella immobilis]|uniref:N-acylglucosamine 2-epimerase n=1 Tax=Tuwongella immobilis TaxID=692036 RepID=A0A6C2YKN2_9BACT|nr:AGE family epimerase/isomerase [Tuwongella immobilis]VIP01937.1 n-acylglucosamine 2-epimerase : N-acylglucosamine 2-epimerase OS=Pirellula staleyi (strain ATCC 27377 / DSM 6068 / ICPB 4128) GN=Psta_1239 PE=4 SV=1: GlcNAc_2-epim [Tuwongella immobilis]VTR99899.1 n-acylglucosamine 2-epimerase : N-acylglucosamine 2-epimerase OS=Pirellula staleyi (strain ATCC 27377 / DSM 6068 / ICPB 4128) GN=Psta_1239 PE=4 SV=1: GlcNAc_2-epim [Tuwongella immobilis]
MQWLSPAHRAALATEYRRHLLDDVIPFWLRHGMDSQQGGYFTALDRDGAVVDTDKSIWFQGRGAWMFATLANTVEPRREWLDAARSGIDFLQRFGRDSSGKYHFTVTRDGRPLRMRRYAFSESFAAIAFAAYARASGDESFADHAHEAFAAYLRYAFDPAQSLPQFPAKINPQTRPMLGIGPLMIGIATAQELRANLGDRIIAGRSCTQWIDHWIDSIATRFLNREHEALLEVVAPDGSVIDHFDGRMLNPGHALECAWFVLQEARQRDRADYRQLGLTILDWMWRRGWDCEYGGIFYFRDLRGLPVQEYWQDMKFWWPHCEAIIATLLAFEMTGESRYAEWHRAVHEWSFRHFADAEFGEWYGYLHRDGRISTPLKGSMWKGPFHLPRMLWYCWRLLEPRG